MTITQQVLIGNCAEILKTLPSESVDCVVTSPPYWGLRDYKTEPLIWDAVEGCEHEWGEEVRKVSINHGQGGSTLTGGHNSWNCSGEVRTGFCAKCGAWRGQLGLEPTPQLYIQHLVSIFDEVKRVLKKTGTCWVNLGDTYGGTTKTAKSLAQVPSRFAIAMTDAGWILRNEIIWWKRNCMPSSVKDRFTVDFEKLFFFTKSKKYYFEQQFEPVAECSIKRAEYGWNRDRANNGADGPQGIHVEKMGTRFVRPSGRNKRCVWDITTRPYKGAHFAVFPPELVETPIKAGTSARGCCPECGAPWRRVVDLERSDVPRYNSKSAGRRDCNYGDSDSTTLRARKIVVRGGDWQPSCTCGREETVPCVVLDPFGGTGTTSEVARRLGRASIIIELNPDYLELVKERARTDIPDLRSFEEVTP